MNFERIDDEHARAKVLGGWIVKAYADVLVQIHGGGLPAAGHEWRVSICFVPDPNHEWQLDKVTDKEHD